MRTYQNGGISPKIQMKRFRETKYFGLRRLRTHATTLQEVRVLPTLDYFHSKGYLALVCALRGSLARFMADFKARSWPALRTSRDSSYFSLYPP